MSKNLPSTKPYMIRAIHEWCSDNGFTPYIAVKVDQSVRVPREFVRDGQIVLNIDYEATGNLQIANDVVEHLRLTSAVSRATSTFLWVTWPAIMPGRNGAGMAFEAESPAETEPAPSPDETADAPGDDRDRRPLRAAKTSAHQVASLRLDAFFTFLLHNIMRFSPRFLQGLGWAVLFFAWHNCCSMPCRSGSPFVVRPVVDFATS